MARKTKSKINKSNAIREIKRSNPEAGPTEISRMIQEQFGVEVTPATVSTVLSTDKKRNGKVGRPGRPKGSKNVSKGASAPAAAAPAASKAAPSNSQRQPRCFPSEPTESQAIGQRHGRHLGSTQCSERS